MPIGHEQRHAPFSESGCVIFVKLRQMMPDETKSLRVFPEDRAWAATTVAGTSKPGCPHRVP